LNGPLVIVRMIAMAALCCLPQLGWCEEPAGAATNATPSIDFDREIRPLLADACFACHGPDADVREADLRLHVKSDLFGERDGSYVVVPGDLLASDLWQRITSDDPSERMPPEDSLPRLTDDQIQLIGRWIEAGAPWSGHWAFESPARPQLPARHDAWSRTSIDTFIAEQLDAADLQPSPEADKATLLRRVSFALTGLPPTLPELDAYQADHRPGGYERVVNRLLASSRYGEHMARTWLDAARYADTDGYQNDRTRYMSPWRDWVIMALNQNMPYDQFTIEQLAGDMLPNATLHQQIATGFGRNHRINSEGGSIPAEWAVEYVVDRIDTLGTIWLGLTIGCARCHDHKYDPISQREYYRLFAYFNNVPEWGLGPNNGNSPPFIKVPKSWPHLGEDEKQAITPEPYELVTTQTSVVRPKPGGRATTMVLQEMATPRPTYLLKRGQYDQPDKTDVLTAGVPSVFDVGGSAPTNRLELARWLVDPDHPLTARVTVNRYWQHFFGTGLVKTSENFGTQGQRPSHARLLDWLAVEFVETGWDVKQLHRLIVTSATFRQSSRVTPKSLAVDPENKLLGRGPRFRLSAQAIRDQSLAISGLLVEQLGGVSVRPYMPPGIWKSISNNKYKQDAGAKLYRRSLYTYWRRTLPPPTMVTFNAAERDVCIVRKDRTTTPLQALTMMNNVTFVEAARFLAERMIREGGESIDERLTWGYTITTGRRPTADELRPLQTAYTFFLDNYQHDPEAAKKLLAVGAKKRDVLLNLQAHAAMTMIANTLLNLNRSLTLE
jgi:mono/diheme cytochrome c family protein